MDLRLKIPLRVPRHGSSDARSGGAGTSSSSACPGLPHDALLGAKETGAFTLGISPAFSEYEHVNEYHSPLENDMMIYTGQGFMERDVINIRSSDGVVFVSGGIGTLNELTIAYDEGRPMGILTGTGGISDSVPYLIQELCKRSIPQNMVFSDNPADLLMKLEVAIRAFPLPIHEDGRIIDKPEGRREAPSHLQERRPG